jgi:isopentenyl-diphosphate delta-isomerase
VLNSIEDVVLVDESDRPIGTAEKLAAHRNGALHRAFSVFIWDDQGRLLLQQRHINKYHSGGLWTNSCCGHPRPGEDIQAAATRRLQEEMGFSCPLEPFGTFVYRADVDGGLIEYEFVHLFRGRYDGIVTTDPAECDDFGWFTPEAIRINTAATPKTYSSWFLKYANAGWPITPPLAPSDIHPQRIG